MYIEQYLGSFENFSEKNALTCVSTGVTLTYKELDRLTNKLGNNFRRDKLK